MSQYCRLSRTEWLRRAREIQFLLLDVDGVLTDGRIVLNDHGVESKNFSVRDGSGISLWRKTGRKVAILSGRSAPVVNLRAAELGIEPVVQGATDKGMAYEKVRSELGLENHQICFMGDDLADLPVITKVGLTAAPSDAAMEVLELVDLVTRARGGQGAVRELIETILKSCLEWDPLVQSLIPSDATHSELSLVMNADKNPSTPRLSQPQDTHPQNRIRGGPL